MRYSQLFGKTKLTTPHDADSVNARYLTQAGFVDKLAAGVYNFLPLGQRVLEKVKQIIREEMNAVDGQEILMPALHPIELWETTGRLRIAGSILYHTKGAGDKDFVLGMSHEETVTPLAKKQIQSYKDLPLCVYQLQTKFRNEPRAKSGLLRGREFGMKDMYSFHTSQADLDQYYEKVKEAYFNVYKRCGLRAYIVTASGGVFTNQLSHEFSVITPAGEDTLIICKKCGIAQNLEIAEGVLHAPEDAGEEKELPMETVNVERGFTVEESAKPHDVGVEKVLKTVVYTLENGGFVGVVIRGDLQVNEMKLTRYLGQNARAATPDELKELGLAQGFISPVGVPAVKGGVKHAAEVQATDSKGIKKGAKTPLPFIGDHSIKSVKNFVTGGNKPGVDLVNVNLGRDFTVSDFTDLVLVEEGFHCKECGSPLTEEKAIEAGNIFKLGTKYSESFELYFTDEKGQRQLVVMGCYGIGSTRLVGTVVEASHDDKGIIWPKSVAPYLVHLVTLGADDEVMEAAGKLYQDFLHQGVEVLFDDREESTGKKLNDADLIGIPLRLVVSKRTLKEKGVEWKLRSEKEAKVVPLDHIVAEVVAFQKS